MSISRLDIYDTVRMTVSLTRDMIFSKKDEIAEYEQVVCIEDKKIYMKVNGNIYSIPLNLEVE